MLKAEFQMRITEPREKLCISRVISRASVIRILNSVFSI